MSYGQIAEKVNKPEQHVIDGEYPVSAPVRVHLIEHLRKVCTGTVSPSHEEFDALARVLDITAAVSVVQSGEVLKS